MMDYTNTSIFFFYRSIDIDALLAEVGEFGRYQKCYIFLLGLALLFTASSTLSFVFTTGDMNYRYVDQRIFLYSIFFFIHSSTFQLCHKQGNNKEGHQNINVTVTLYSSRYNEKKNRS